MYLDNFSTHTSLEHELAAQKKLVASQLCQYSKKYNECCPWLRYVIITLKTGLEESKEIEFTDFLRRGK